jgi:hypothetical protein
MVLARHVHKCRVLAHDKRSIPHVIRITTHTEAKRTIVTIDGQVAESDVKAIRRVRNSVSGAVLLNLRGLDACAAGGVRLLSDWLKAGAKLQNATPFMEMILKDSSS